MCVCVAGGVETRENNQTSTSEKDSAKLANKWEEATDRQVSHKNTAPHYHTHAEVFYLDSAQCDSSVARILGCLSSFSGGKLRSLASGEQEGEEDRTPTVTRCLSR